MKIILYNILLTLLFVPILVLGQANKRAVRVADYEKWNMLHAEELSADGLWVSYKLGYDYGADSLFVQNTHSGKRLAFSSATNAVFSDDGKWFSCTDNENTLSVLELKTEQLKTYAKVIRHEFHSPMKYWVVLSNLGESTELIIQQYGKNQVRRVLDVKDFSIAKDGTIAIIRSHDVAIMKPAKNFTLQTIATDVNATFKKLQWSKSGHALAFFEELSDDEIKPQNHKIYWYTTKDSKLRLLESSAIDSLQPQRIVLRKGAPAATFSGDENSLFFAVASEAVPIEEEKYQIWDSATAYEYALNKYHSTMESRPKLWVWTVDSAQLQQVSTLENPSVLLDATKQYGLIFNPMLYEPQYEHYPPADFYIRDWASSEQHLLLKNYSTAIGMMGGSPDGRYIHYFKEGDWWLYDNTKRSHLNLTKGLGLQLTDSSDQYPGLVVPVGCPGWSIDGKSIILYDYYDIWLFSADGKTTTRITDGSKDKVRYRIYKDLYNRSIKQTKDDLPSPSYDFSKGLVLEALGEDMESGYFKWLPSVGLKKIVYEKTGNSRLRKARNSETYLFVEESASLPPRLMIKESKVLQSKLVFESNNHAKQYQWGTAELIDYKNSANQKLRGILYKPSNYIQGQKYPMVVLVYENITPKFNDYIRPTEYSPMGFTPPHYFLDGYLVLVPDIRYTIGSPGKSAADCIESAIADVKKRQMVLEDRIGIIGHSYGGYEAAFVISQSSTFAAAVSGSGIMNLTASYFTYEPENIRSNAWRFESQQGRMACTPFDNWESYQENSPIRYANQITTPLFSWAGKKDYNVLWKQSAELHMALRRLGKKNLFLVYGNESHTIRTPELQKDLTIKTKNWFDYYLKERKDSLLTGMH